DTLRCADRNVFLDEIAAALLLRDEGIGERSESSVALVDLIGAQESHRIRERDRALAFLSLDGRAQAALHGGSIGAERALDERGGAVIETGEDLAESLRKGFGERLPLGRLQR